MGELVGREPKRIRRGDVSTRIEVIPEEGQHDLIPVHQDGDYTRERPKNRFTIRNQAVTRAIEEGLEEAVECILEEDQEERNRIIEKEGEAEHDKAVGTEYTGIRI